MIPQSRRKVLMKFIETNEVQQRESLCNDNFQSFPVNFFSGAGIGKDMTPSSRKKDIMKNQEMC